MESKRAVQRRSGCAVRVQACSAGGHARPWLGAQRDTHPDRYTAAALGSTFERSVWKRGEGGPLCGHEQARTRLMFVVYPLIPLSKLGTITTLKRASAEWRLYADV